MPTLTAARNAVALTFFLNGLVFASWVSRIPEVRSSFDLTNGQLGLVLLAIAMGSVLALPTTGAAINALGTVRIVRLGTVAATLGMAALWATGALASGPIRLGRARTRDGRTSRSALQGFLLGALLLAVFLAGAVVVGRIPVLRAPVESLLDHARYGSLAIVLLVTAVNGVAEELFFRGAVPEALPPRWVVPGSVLLYALSTVLSGVPLLTFAAVCLGLLTALQRRVTGGVLGPIVSHLTWSLGMLLLLPDALNLGQSL